MQPGFAQCSEMYVFLHSGWDSGTILKHCGEHINKDFNKDSNKDSNKDCKKD